MDGQRTIDRSQKPFVDDEEDDGKLKYFLIINNFVARRGVVSSELFQIYVSRREDPGRDFSLCVYFVYKLAQIYLFKNHPMKLIKSVYLI